MIRLAKDGIIVLSNMPSFAGEIRNLHTAAFGFMPSLSLTEYRIKERMKDPEYEAYGYMLNGSLVGFFFLHSVNAFGIKTIESFCVIPWQKRRGIGSQMLWFILNKYGSHDFQLTAAPENKPARGLYKRFGFVEVNENNMERNVKCFS